MRWRREPIPPQDLIDQDFGQPIVLKSAIKRLAVVALLDPFGQGWPRAAPSAVKRS